ncbi:MAG TPA: methyltransferase [Gemmatimonadota bacterium]|nr:methyltransferase [Gemmatimonadota bacterium]
MSARWIAFGALVAAEGLLLVSLTISAVRPAWRTWPPPGPRSWQLAWSWGLLGVAAVAGAVLAIADYGSFVLDHWGWKAAGAALLVAAEVFNEWSVRTVGRHASRGLGGELVTAGPYALSRNPQYLAQSAMVVAIALIADSTLLAFAAPLGIAALLLTPWAEERWLEERHGDAYGQYRGQVPRFLGRRRR